MLISGLLPMWDASTMERSATLEGVTSLLRSLTATRADNIHRVGEARRGDNSERSDSHTVTIQLYNKKKNIPLSLHLPVSLSFLIFQEEEKQKEEKRKKTKK